MVEQEQEQERIRPAGTGGAGQGLQGKVGASVSRSRQQERRRRKSHRWKGMFSSTMSYTRKGERTSIRFGSYNIRNGRNGGFELVLQGMYLANLDLGIFQETKIMDRVYTRRSADYSVVTTDVLSQHRGGVALFYCLSTQFEVEDIQQFGPNIISSQLAMDERRWYIIGYYLTPDDALTIESVVAALIEHPQGSELLVAGYFNADFAQPEGAIREEEIAAALMTAVLEDMLAHFLPRRRPWC